MLDTRTSKFADTASSAPHRTNERTSVEHELKSWPELFEAMRTGIKTHELRRSNDRDFRVGDTLRLREFNPELQSYTGRELVARITYITSANFPCALSGQALHPDYCILSVVTEK